MGAGNYSVEATVIDNGKNIKGTLTLFIDEYVFGSKRTSINWEKASIQQGTIKMKAFLRSVDKPFVVFSDENATSCQFILEPNQLNKALSAITGFSNSIRKTREEKLTKERKAQEEKARQEENERRIREESRIAAEEEYQKKQKEEQRKKEEKLRQEREARERVLREKKTRIQREVENCKEQNNGTMELKPIAKKAGALFLDNPYRILGISCRSSNEEANLALDKLKKLARLKALESYRSSFDLYGLEKPVRDLSVAQNALASLKDKSNKWFWFAEPDSCTAWKSGKYRIELSKDGQEFGTYDLFLANYMYAVLCDPNFEIAETWKRVLNYYCFICRQSDCTIIRSRFTDKELDGTSNRDLLNNFKSAIFKPLLSLCDRDDLDAIIRLHKYIKDCGSSLLDGLTRNVLGKLVSWFTDKEAVELAYLQKIDSEESISEETGREVTEHGEEYCGVVEPVLQIVLRDFRGDTVRYDMIKESYRHVTYQYMYELNKCVNKSNAILFANKCYSYCNADDKKRIQNTFGEVNIKVIDWNTPHTSWDAKGDDFYFGRGCAVDYTQALYWYHKAADEGNMYSPNSIGICYQKGNGVPQDDAQAAAWFEKAYNAKNPEGAYNLAECYFTGTGVRKDIDRALKLWAEADKLGHPSAGKRREDVFSKVQGERIRHRARNHICQDLGFQMPIGANLVVEVTINRAANVYLVNAQAYQNYLAGKEFSYRGGYTTDLTSRLTIPTSNRWYIIVDNGDEPITGTTASAKVKSVR